MSQPNGTSILILGTGIAGLSAALKFAKIGAVTLVAKADRAEGSTRYAQGGIASVWSKQDSFEEHKEDTRKAGAGLCHPHIVDLCVREGPSRVQELIDLGVEFTKIIPSPNGPPTGTQHQDPTEVFDLHREGGHGKRRILHADDLTGSAIEQALLQQVENHSQIQVLENHIAIDLITEGKILKRWRKPGRCLGAYILNTHSGQVLTLAADVTVLATGGAGKVYLYTTNPDVATGDGIAMAYRAGAQVSNLEFMQFHPTCLYHSGSKTFLITEALRGEGAILRTIRGDEFMIRHHPMASLAPRDIVARAIDIELKRSGDKYVHLDCSPLSKDELKSKFPNIYETCLGYGIDITLDPIPVVPAAHYMCGGIQVNEHAQTTVEGLYAIGEVACTGLHGANRLASNSLLEAVVFAHRAFEHAKENPAQPEKRQPIKTLTLPEWDIGKAVQLEEKIDIAANWLEIRHLMWNYVGIVRSNRRLERAQRRLNLIKAEIEAYYWNFLLTQDLIELRNLLTVSELIVQCALLRKESRGLHYTVDYPSLDTKNPPQDSIL